MQNMTYELQNQGSKLQAVISQKAGHILVMVGQEKLNC